MNTHNAEEQSKTIKVSVSTIDNFTQKKNRNSSAVKMNSITS